MSYTGTNREAFLPAVPEAVEVASLLAEGFRRRLMFTIGTSVTTGRSN